MFRRKMALEKVEGSLEKVAMGIHEREKEKINKVSALRDLGLTNNFTVILRVWLLQVGVLQLVRLSGL
jgi:hypothetical protein